MTLESRVKKISTPNPDETVLLGTAYLNLFIQSIYASTDAFTTSVSAPKP